jgi:hypothetical protein
VDQVFGVFSRIHQFSKRRINAIKKHYNAFLPFMVQIDTIRHGRKVVKLRLICKPATKAPIRAPSRA